MAGPGDPYANHLNIGITLDTSKDGFSCQEIAEELTAFMIILAPELLPEDALEGFELEALCGLMDNITSIVNTLGAAAHVPRRVRGLSGILA